MREYCTGFDGQQRDPDLQVFERLADVYNQLQDQICSSLPPNLVSSLSSIVARFYRTTVLRSEQSASCLFSDTCAVRTIASRNYSFHHEIDRLLSFPGVKGDVTVHDWKPRWRDTERQLARSFPVTLRSGAIAPQSAGLAAIAEMTCEVAGEERGVENADLEEKAVLLQFEATKRRGAYSVDALKPLDIAQKQFAGSLVVPEWFIPSYEVELGEFIAEGSFGAVYRGRWFDSDVVVKILLGNSPDQRREFVREAEIWFALNHPNVVQLFGACHVGPRPFFVCEFPGQLTLKEALGSQLFDDDDMILLLHAAAGGLLSLHEHGIVHGDLKGNNILVDHESFPKLADFGLTRIVRGDEDASDGVGALGAYRWKAPECLSGSRPTFASDVYSFAMCIIEAKTGEFPWGPMDDATVKFHVVRGELPARPSCFQDHEWDLVLRMCCFDPDERLDMAAVLDTLDQWRRQMWYCEYCFRWISGDLNLGGRSRADPLVKETRAANTNSLVLFAGDAKPPSLWSLQFYGIQMDGRGPRLEVHNVLSVDIACFAFDFGVGHFLNVS